jgi:hypothetical protein
VRIVTAEEKAVQSLGTPENASRSALRLHFEEIAGQKTTLE